MDKPTTQTVSVLVTPPYDVYVGTGLLNCIANHVAHKEIIILADVHTADYANTVAAGFRATDRRPLIIIVEPGERSKSIGSWEKVLEDISRAKITRSAALIAVGGGVVGDLGGYVAASYLRGIDFYQVPTTVLSMVDASVGGKTGLNLATGKNLVGAFHQPQAVFADVNVLATLPRAEFQSGTTELFKAGLIADYALAEHLLTYWSQFTTTDVVCDYLVQGIRVKADIVAIDPLERGPRAFLNLGHTLAHAIEAATQHAVPHGVAVAYGLYFAAELGAQRGLFDYRALTSSFLAWLDVSYDLPNFETLIPFLERDKKAGPDGRKYVLLAEKDSPVLVDDVRLEEELKAYAALQEVVS